MKAFIILSFILIGAFCATSLEETLLRDLFTQWRLKHNKSYKPGHEEEHRFKIFVNNYIYIKEHNLQHKEVTLALNKFADLTNEEFAKLYTSPIPTRSNEEITDFETNNLSTPPAAVDWRSVGAVTPVQDQLACDSDWAIAAVDATSSFYFINGNPLTEFSVQQVVDCDTNSGGCIGGMAATAFAYIASNGLENEADYPYTGTTDVCTYDSSKAISTGVVGVDYVTTKSTVALKTQLAIQPVVVLLQSSQAVFQFYSTGVIMTGCGYTVDHVALAVGYGNVGGRDAFIVKNSWSDSWGDDGYVYISSTNSINGNRGACGILVEPQFPY